MLITSEGKNCPPNRKANPDSNYWKISTTYICMHICDHIRRDICHTTHTYSVSQLGGKRSPQNYGENYMVDKWLATYFGDNADQSRLNHTYVAKHLMYIKLNKTTF